MKHLILAILFLPLASCQQKVTKETQFAPKDICECYTDHQAPNIDERLEECIKPLNDFLDVLLTAEFDEVEASALTKNGLKQVMEHMSKSCDAFRKTFMDNSHTMFAVESKEMATEIIENSNQESTSVNKFKLAKAYYTVDQLDEAILQVDQYIKNSSSADLAYWMKAHSHSLLNQVTEAVNAIDKGIATTENESIVEFFGFYRNVIQPKVEFSGEKIVLKITR